MAGKDLVGRARTGSGKTLAFSLPMIEGILSENAENPSAGRGYRPPRALVLAPTRELAKQVAGELQSATLKGQVSVCTVYGGTPIGNQVRQIRSGVDVVVGTPGRILDLTKKQRCARIHSPLHRVTWTLRLVLEVPCGIHLICSGRLPCLAHYCAIPEQARRAL